MTDEEILDVYAKQMSDAARRGKDEYDGKENVAALLVEFQERCYLAGRHTLIDNLRREIDRHDDRKSFRAAGNG